IAGLVFLIQAAAPFKGFSANPISHPCILRGVQVDPSNPLRLNFLIDTGDAHLKGKALEQESMKLVQYFLTAMTVPKDELWVNLGPGEYDRVIPPVLARTEMGKQMLEQDYALKMKASALTNPNGEFGRRFWQKVHQGDTFDRLWIVPDRAVVYETAQGAYIGE